MAESKKNTSSSSSKGNSTKSSSKKSATSKAKQSDSTKTQQSVRKSMRVKDEIWALVLIAMGAFLILALQVGAAGQFGVAMKTLLMGSFGAVAYVLPYYLIVYGILLFAKKASHVGGRSTVFLVVIFMMLTLLNSGRFIDSENLSFSLASVSQLFDAGAAGKSGGLFGMALGMLLVKLFGKVGLYIISVVVIIISIMLVMNTPVSQFFDQYKEKREAKKKIREAQELLAAAEEEEERQKAQASSYPGAKDTLELDKVGKAKRQMRIIDYMKDKSLFDAEKEKEGVGLEPVHEPHEGLGLDGTAGAAPLAKPEKSDIAVSTYNAPEHDPILDEIPTETAATDLRTEDKKGEDSAGEQTSDLTDEPIDDKKMEPTLSNKEASQAMLNKDEINQTKPPRLYKLPPSDFLKAGPATDTLVNNEGLKAKAMKLEQTLHDFNVNAKVVQVTMGPAVTRYEIQPNTGVKVNSIVRLADDIALNLEAKSIRIEAPIPGKAAVGIEVENERINLVSLREIIDSREFKTAKSKITFAVGKDIAGKSIVADLKSMPHLLIAGSTGSGKSVCINSIIMSLLYKAKPDEVKFVLIDPKVVELGNYNGIPHLLIPVVTEPGKAAAALNWAVAEMTDRYKKFADSGVRDLESYNETMRGIGAKDAVLPQIVIIIDELADLMMAAPSQVEESICRLAQMARAAGMHLIVATQRPSVDVITGVIKANIPSRIAFAVSSQFDSRTILDMGGAEKLVGKGDMLFNPLGSGKPIRVQGTFVSDSEVHSVIEYVKEQVAEVEYSEEVLHSIDKVQTNTNQDDDGDELLAEAIETVVLAKQASASMLQRRFRIGYNRAARLVEMMEARGIIGPADGSRPRAVLMSEDELNAATEESSEA